MAQQEPLRRPTVTIRDVARVADVHISTVSRALDPAKSSLVSPVTRARVVAAAEELGYRPHLIASQLRRGQTRTVGVVVPNLGNPLYAPLVRGVTHALDRDGYMPLVADTQDDPVRLRRVVRHLWNRRVDALITTAARTGDRKFLLDVLADEMPVVLAVRTLPGACFPSVTHDDAAGATMAARHLHDLGHRLLAQLPGPLDVAPFIARTTGFAESVRGLSAELVPVCDAATLPTVNEGRRLMELLLSERGALPTGIFAQNDQMALGALEALRRAGLRCPEDVSLVGYNDTFFAGHARPALTTVRLPSYDVGRLAGSMAIGWIEQPDDPPASVSAPPSLVVRESTATAPQRVPMRLHRSGAPRE